MNRERLPVWLAAVARGGAGHRFAPSCLAYVLMHPIIELMALQNDKSSRLRPSQRSCSEGAKQSRGTKRPRAPADIDGVKFTRRPWAPLFRWSIVILAGSLAYAVVRMLWRSWVRSEHALILDHRQLSGVPIRLYAFGVVLLIVLLLSFFAATAVWSWPPGPWRLDLSDAFLLLWSLFTWCLIVFWAMTRIFPPPGRSVLPGRPTEVPRSHDAPSETR